MKFRIQLVALGIASVCGGPVMAQGYPNKSIRIIVPVAPGGNVDIVARTIAAALTKSLGQTVIVENRPSAASLVGTQQVAKAAPDGYTLLAHSSTYFSAPTIRSRISRRSR